MNYLDQQRVLHDLSQPLLKESSADLDRHLGRIKIDSYTRDIVDGLHRAFIEKCELVNELYKENDQLKAISADATK